MFSRLTPIAEYIPCPLIFQSDYNLSLRRIISLTLPTPMHEMPVVSVPIQLTVFERGPLPNSSIYYESGIDKCDLKKLISSSPWGVE